MGGLFSSPKAPPKADTSAQEARIVRQEARATAEETTVKVKQVAEESRRAPEKTVSVSKVPKGKGGSVMCVQSGKGGQVERRQFSGVNERDGIWYTLNAFRQWCGDDDAWYEWQNAYR